MVRVNLQITRVSLVSMYGETFSSICFLSYWDLKVQVVSDIFVLKPVVSPNEVIDGQY